MPEKYTCALKTHEKTKTQVKTIGGHDHCYIGAAAGSSCLTGYWM